MRHRTETWRAEKRWDRWTEKEARAAFKELITSGESMAAFCRRKGISPQRLTYWRKRIVLPETTGFVAVDLAEVTAPRFLEIVARGVVVRVREDLDVDRVAHLVEAIGRRVSGTC